VALIKRIKWKAQLISEGKQKKRLKQAPMILEAQECFKWEAGDEEVISLWKKMNQWVMVL
jgi:arginyl-tRNA synthetase